MVSKVGGARAPKPHGPCRWETSGNWKGIGELDENMMKIGWELDENMMNRVGKSCGRFLWIFIGYFGWIGWIDRMNWWQTPILSCAKKWGPHSLQARDEAFAGLDDRPNLAHTSHTLLLNIHDLWFLEEFPWLFQSAMSAMFTSQATSRNPLEINPPWSQASSVSSTRISGSSTCAMTSSGSSSSSASPMRGWDIWGYAKIS